MRSAVTDAATAGLTAFGAATALALGDMAKSGFVSGHAATGGDTLAQSLVTAFATDVRGRIAAEVDADGLPVGAATIRTHLARLRKAKRRRRSTTSSVEHPFAFALGRGRRTRDRGDAHAQSGMRFRRRERQAEDVDDDDDQARVRLVLGAARRAVTADYRVLQADATMLLAPSVPPCACSASSTALIVSFMFEPLAVLYRMSSVATAPHFLSAPLMRTRTVQPDPPGARLLHFDIAA